MRLAKKLLLFATELSILFFGFIFSAVLGAYLGSIEGHLGLAAFLVAFSLVYVGLVFFRKRTRRWTTNADATAWLKRRQREKMHPSWAKYQRLLLRSFLWLPSVCGAFVLFLLPVASHFVDGQQQLAPHYRMSPPWNWLLIKDVDYAHTWCFFSDGGASRYGLTPFSFSHGRLSSAAFRSSEPQDDSGWWRPENERASGKTAHVAVREFQLGMIRMTCYEYRHVYEAPESSPTIVWESLCSTKANGVNYNLRAGFFGDREDLPSFYRVLNSATPEN